MKMQKARRVLEGIAKWSSLILATVSLAACPLVGFTIGDSEFTGGGVNGVVYGVVFLIVGVVLALLATGWVLAISRLNAEVEAMRRQLAAHAKSK